MSLDETAVEGTLKPDGTLELDQKPALPPGRVTVVLRPCAESAPSTESLWQFMQRTRRELEATGRTFMNDQEMTEHIDWMREGDQIDEWLGPTGKASNSPEPS